MFSIDCRDRIWNSDHIKLYNVASAHTLYFPNIPLHHSMMPNLSSIICLFAPRGSPTSTSPAFTSIELSNIDPRLLELSLNLSLTLTATLVSLPSASQKLLTRKAICKPHAQVVKKNVWKVHRGGIYKWSGVNAPPIPSNASHANRRWLQLEVQWKSPHPQV